MKSSPDPFYVYILACKGVVGGARIFDPVSQNTLTFFFGHSYVKYITKSSSIVISLMKRKFMNKMPTSCTLYRTSSSTSGK